MRRVVRHIIISVSILFLLVTFGLAYRPAYKLKSGDVLITDFEFDPNCLGGNVDCYGAVGGKGSGSWPYSGYTAEESYSNKKSYRLVFTKHAVWKPEYEEEYEKSPLGTQRMKTLGKLGKASQIDWAVFMMDMGPVLNPNKVPVEIQCMDISKYRYLVFWVKGGQGGERFNVYMRDSHAPTYEPQIKIKPKTKVSIYWQPVAINLHERELRLDIDLTKIIQIGIGFGKPDGGRPGSVLYIDNFILVK